MIYHAYTIRDGVFQCGNAWSLNVIWRDLRTDRGAIRRAHDIARFASRDGDVIVIEHTTIGTTIGEGREVARFTVDKAGRHRPTTKTSHEAAELTA